MLSRKQRAVGLTFVGECRESHGKVPTAATGGLDVF